MKKKFMMVNTVGHSMRIHLNEEGRDGWHFVKMEPCFQLQRMTASHGMGKFLVSLEKNPNFLSFYRVKFIEGKERGAAYFINEVNQHMEQCGFEFIDYHHVIVLHLDPGYNRRPAMKGYLCLWEIQLEYEMAAKMLERMNAVLEKIRKEVDIDKLKGAPRISVYKEIKDKYQKYKNKQKEYKKQIEEMGVSHFRLDKDEELAIKQFEAYQYLNQFIKRIIELDNQELKKQMGKDWDDGLVDIEPDIDAVIDSLSFDISIEILVEEIFWSSQGNLIASSLPE